MVGDLEQVRDLFGVYYPPREALSTDHRLLRALALTSVTLRSHCSGLASRPGIAYGDLDVVFCVSDVRPTPLYPGV